MTLTPAVVGEQRYCLPFTLMKSFIVNCIETNSENWSALSKVIIKSQTRHSVYVCLEVVDAYRNLQYVRLCTNHFGRVVSLMQNVFVVYSFPIVLYVLANCRCYRQRS